MKKGADWSPFFFDSSFYDFYIFLNYFILSSKCSIIQLSIVYYKYFNRLGGECWKGEHCPIFIRLYFVIEN